MLQYRYTNNMFNFFDTSVIDGYVRGGVITNGKGHSDGGYRRGGGIYISNTAKVVMYGGTIAGNYVSNANGAGAGVYVANGGTFEMYGGTIAGNYSEGYGGGIATEPSTTATGIVTINPNSPVYISKNTATQSGGGIYLTTNKETTIARYTANGVGYPQINGNVATYRGGGGLYMASGVNISTIGADFNYNQANGSTSTTSISLIGGGAVLSDDGANHLYTGNFTGNTSAYRGGAIYTKAGNTTVSGNFISNSANNEGGAIASIAETSKITINGSEMRYNVSKSEGGAVCATGAFAMTDGVIMYNVSATKGAGISLGDGNYNTQFSGSPVIRGNYRGGTLDTSTNKVTGGTQSNLYLCSKPGSSRYISFLAALTSGADIHVSFNEYTTEAAFTKGYNTYNDISYDAGKYISVDDLTKSVKYTTLGTVTNLMLTESNETVVATVTSSDGTFAAGYTTFEKAVQRFNTSGAFDGNVIAGVSDDTGKTLKLITDITVSGTTVNEITSSGNLDLNGKLLARYDASTTKAAVLKVSGETTTLNILSSITNASIKFNADEDTNQYTYNANGTAYTSNVGVITGGGDAGLVITNATVNLKNAGIVGNTNINTTEGGGVRVDGGTLNMTDGTIRGNATRWGGGVFVKNGGTMIMDGANASVCYNGVTSGAWGDGGGIQIGATGGTFELKNGSIDHNKGRNGAGLFVNKPSGSVPVTVKISGGSISDNAATAAGGGISLRSQTVTITGGTIENNTAVTFGGGIYVEGGTIAVTGSNVKINNNSVTGTSAQNGGGAICVMYTSNGYGAGVATLSGITMQGNTAANLGGGILNYGRLSLTEVTVSGNSAKLGGGIYSNGVSTEIHSGYVKDNTSTTNGGGVYIAGGTSNSISGTVSGNTATLNGGGLYVAGGTANIAMVSANELGIISGNKAVDGAGIYSAGGATNIYGKVVTNTSSNSGGGVYVHGGTVTMYSGALINGNTATNGAGGGAYIHSGTLAMTGTTSSIQYNATKTTTNAGAQGAGVHVATSGTFSVQDGAIVANNKSGGTVTSENAVNGGSNNNIYLASGSDSTTFEDYKKITITDALNANAQLNVTLDNYDSSATHTRDITENYNNYDHDNKAEPTRHFALDGTTPAGLSISATSYEVTVGSNVVVLITGSGAETYYSLMAPAITAFNALNDDGKTLMLLSDIVMTTDAKFTSTGTLDLNGYSLSRQTTTTGSVIWVASGTLTINDSPATASKHANTDGRTHKYIISDSNGGMYLLDTTDSFATITGGVIYGANSKQGGGIFVGDNGNTGSASVILNGGTIAGNQTSGYGAGVYVNKVSTFTMNGGSIEGNVTTGSNSMGAGVYINGGTFNMTGGTIKLNNNYDDSNGNGGGVAVGAGGTFNMSGNALITLNRGNCGGGVYLVSDAATTFTMTDNAKIVGNTSSTEGSVGGIQSTRNVNFAGTISLGGNVQITDNVAATGTSFDDAYDVQLDNHAYTVTLKGTTQRNLYLENTNGATITVNGTFGENAKIGLSLRNAALNTVLTTNYSVSNNTSNATGNRQPAKYFSLDGGATSAAVISLSSAGEAILLAPIVSLTQTVDSAAVTTYYGAFALAVEDFNKSSDSTKEITLLDNNPVYSIPALNESGTLNLNDKILYGTNNVACTLSVLGYSTNDAVNITIKDGAAKTAKYYVVDTDNTNAATSTCGLYKFFKADGTPYTASDEGVKSITGGLITGGATGFTTSNNRYGAGLFVYAATVTIEGGTIAGNYVNGISLGDSKCYGGGVAVLAGGSVIMNGGSIEGNYAQHMGGGVYVSSSSTFNLAGGTIQNNSAVNGNGLGGGVAIGGGTLNMTGGEIKANSANNGGGVYLASGEFNMSGASKVNKNTAINQSNGGGIYAAGGTLNIAAGEISSNIAGRGAEIFILSGTHIIGSDAGTVIMDGGYTTDGGNYGETIYGGGLYVRGGTVTIINTTIQNHNATIGGAGLNVAGGTVNARNVTIQNNITTNSYNSQAIGAGVFVGPATVTLTDCTIQNNTSASHGGGIATNSASTNLTITRGTIKNNTANGLASFGKGGAGLYADGNGTISLNNVEITGNKATDGLGGGVLSYSPVTLTDCTITGNTAAKGGGVYSSNTRGVTLSGDTITGNTATVVGGGVYFAGGVLKIEGSLNITENTVSESANNLYIEGANKLTILSDAMNSINGSTIGISLGTMEAGKVITTGYSDSATASDDPQNFFTLDGSLEYVLTLVDSSADSDAGEVCIATAIVSLTINGKETAYHELDTAVAAYNASTVNTKVLKLLVNIDDIKKTTEFTQTGTFDLNGMMFKASTTSNNFPVITVASGTLTIKDSNYGSTHTASLAAATGAVDDSVYITGGLITGGKNTSGNGGGVLVKDGATLKIESGNIAGNQAANGAGVYLESGATLNAVGGRIVGNVALGSTAAGGGVYVAEGATIKIESAPTIAENFVTTDSTVSATSTLTNSNVQLIGSSKITVSGALTEQALVGVSMANTSQYSDSTTVFTSGYTTAFGTASVVIPSAVFTSDYSDTTNGHYQAILVPEAETNAGEVRWTAHSHVWVFKADTTNSAKILALCSATSGCPFTTTTYEGTTYGDGGYISIEAPTQEELATFTYDGITEHRLTINQSLYGDAATEAKPAVKYVFSATAADIDSSTTYQTPVHAGYYKAVLSVGSGSNAVTVYSDVYEVKKASLTITASDVSITYGDDPATYYTANIVGFKGADSETELNVVLTFSSDYKKGDNVSDTPIAINVEASGNLNDYEITYVKGNLHVSKKVITVSGITANDKIYDGTTQATANTDDMVFDGIYGSDELDVTFTIAFTDDRANDAVAVLITDIQLVESDKSGNYELITDELTTTAKIAKRKVTVLGGIVAQDRVYDGTAVVELSFGEVAFADGEAESDKLDDETFTALIAADGLTLSDSVTGKMLYEDGTDDSDAGYNKTVTISALALAYKGAVTSDVDLSGLKVGTSSVTASALAAANDYELVSTTYTPVDPYTTTKVNITKKPISVTGGITLNEEGKTYDATTDATSLINISGATLSDEKLSGDDLYVALLQANFVDKNAGENKPIVIELTLSGDDAENYMLRSDTYDIAVTANINQKVIVINNVNAVSKQYDGTRDAYITLGVNDVALSDKNNKKDDITITADGSYDSASVGQNKTVTFTYNIQGADAGNYVIDTVNSKTETTGEITKRILTVTADAISAVEKTYDGTTAITLEVDESKVDGIIAGETIVITPAGVLESTAAGENKAVDITSYAVSGVYAGNYEVNYDGSAKTTTATVDKAPITITGIEVSQKFYDGTATAVLDFTNATIIGLVGDDTLEFSGTGTFDDINAGDGKTVTIKDITFTGAAKDNYTLGNAEGQQTEITGVTINKKIVAAPDVTEVTLTYTGEPQTVTALTGLDGATLDGSPSVLDAGEYEVRLTLADPLNMVWSDGTLDDTIVFQIIVKKFQVTKPTADLTQFFYNGKEQTYTIVENSEHSAYYTVTGNTRKDVGEQTVTVTLNNTTNYQWATDDGTDDIAPVTFTFKIAQGDYYDEQPIIWIEIVLACALLFEIIWLAVLVHRRNKLASIAPIGLLAFIPVWEIVLIIVLAVVVLVFLVFLIFATHKYFERRRQVIAHTSESEGLVFEKLDGGDGYCVAGIGSCKDEHIVIPAYVEGLPVTAIKQGAFENIMMRTIYIPASVQSIGAGAFSGCRLLEKAILIGDDREWYVIQSEGKRKLLKNICTKPVEAVSCLTVKYNDAAWVKERKEDQ
jgi:hypothetical protein